MDKNVITFFKMNNEISYPLSVRSRIFIMLHIYVLQSNLKGVISFKLLARRRVLAWLYK